ncbi:MAG: replicative DNA helicase [Marinilabiliales bacterium]|nr:MAG: replicative DNA helicase [Marinilabiliales bacterium]
MEEKQNKKTGTVRKSTTKNRSQIPVDHGRVPPQATDLEEVILGALMLEREAVNVIIDILRPEIFYKESHQFIFTAIRDLFAKSSPIDMLTVTDELRSMGKLEAVGGAHYIAFLTNRVVSAANVEYHARIVAQKYIQRRLIEISSEVINEAFEDSTDVFDLLDKAEDKLFKINEQNLRRGIESMPNLLRAAKEQIELASKNTDDFTGVPSGFKDLDAITAGWQPSDLIIIAARPGMGKTAFVLSMARNMAVSNERPVAVFSLEMSATQLVMRLVSSESGISSEDLRKGNLSPTQWKSLNDNMDNLSRAPIYIDDTPALSVFELRAKARRLKQQFDIQCIVIDYLQLMTAQVEKGGNREQEISTISRSLKALAKELSIPVITLSQLSREVEKRPGMKRPQLSDLRESGAIEQDADMVLFIYREEYYFKDDPNHQNQDIRNKAELIISKHRNGPLDTVHLRFINQYARFEGMEKDIGDFASYMENTDLSSIAVTKQSKMNDDPPEDFTPKDPDF